MGGKSVGDVIRQGASGTLFELWFSPRRTIVGRFVFTFLMFLLCLTSLCIVHMYLPPWATAHKAVICVNRGDMGWKESPQRVPADMSLRSCRRRSAWRIW